MARFAKSQLECSAELYMLKLDPDKLSISQLLCKLKTAVHSLTSNLRTDEEFEAKENIKELEDSYAQMKATIWMLNFSAAIQ